MLRKWAMFSNNVMAIDLTWEVLGMPYSDPILMSSVPEITLWHKYMQNKDHSWRRIDYKKWVFCLNLLQRQENLRNHWFKCFILQLWEPVFQSEQFWLRPQSQGPCLLHVPLVFTKIGIFDVEKRRLGETEVLKELKGVKGERSSFTWLIEHLKYC